MLTLSRRSLLVGLTASMILPVASRAAEPVKEIRIDWATYNPVSMVLKQKGLLEKEFSKDGISIVWVQSAGSNKALEFLNPGSIDFGLLFGRDAVHASPDIRGDRRCHPPFSGNSRSMLNIVHFGQSCSRQAGVQGTDFLVDLHL